MPLQEPLYVLRRLLQSPGFIIAAVLMSALGFGASTAMFSAMNELLIQLLPASFFLAATAVFATFACPMLVPARSTVTAKTMRARRTD